uniref:RNA polymerase sigma-54 factor n=1 Tax=candidate division WOR-3 bacterium TaxID=2052148 RepID=A0A7C6AG32_UNCW3
MERRGSNLYHGLGVSTSIMHSLTYYLKLLEMPNIELEALVRQELDTNPLLEEIEEEPEQELEENEVNKSKNEEFDLLDFYAREDLSNSSDYSEEEQLDLFENAPAQNDKLYDHLMKQAERKFSGRELEIAELIISNIEEDGYLTISPEELVSEGYTLDEIEKVRKEIQTFEPVGCAWRDVREPLLAQLKNLGYAPDSVESTLVRDYLKNLRTGNLKECLEILNIDEARLNQARQVIMKLDPKPGLQYSRSDSPYVYPDFIVYWQDNELNVRLNEENLPKIRIKREYLEKINQNSDEIEFIKQKLKSAYNLIRAIEKRRITLSKITKALLDYQKEYFLNGDSFLKSITIVDFAKQLGVNPSTVSRAIANKYLESPRGIHKLKFFFTAPLGSTDKSYIFDKIKETIQNENKSSPLSDVQIAKKLTRMGIIISRRTVTKYREMLNIPPHNLRRI